MNDKFVSRKPLFMGYFMRWGLSPSYFMLLLIFAGNFSCLLGQQNLPSPHRVLLKFQSDIPDKHKTSLREEFGAKLYKETAHADMQIWQISEAMLKAGRFDKLSDWIRYAKTHLPIDYIEADIVYRATRIPDDPAIARQWGLNNEGQNGGEVGADIDAFQAWELATDARGVAIAVIDAGIDWRHEDLVENIWQNLAEDADGDGQVLEWSGDSWQFDPGDVNGIDDDGNGYVDDFIGWDFVNNDNDPSDDTPYGHGTHVSGISGASGNNGIGMSGLSWQARMMPLKFLNANSQGFLSDAVAALSYAVNMQARISNNSWGGYTPSLALYDAIEQASNAGHLFVAAAGNDGINNDDTPLYPASYDLDNIISVAASDSRDQLASFSNYGPNTVDLLAPGEAIYSTLPGNQYGYSSGTSMATPWVSSAAALLWTLNPAHDYAAIKRGIINTVDLAEGLQGTSVSSGRLNVYKMLSEDPVNNLCALEADFSVMDYSSCRNQQIVFVNHSTQAKNYRWEINGQVVGENNNLIYTFETPALYAVTLIAIGDSCQDALTRFVTISAMPQISIEDVNVCREAAWLDAGFFPGITYEWRDERNRLLSRARAFSAEQSGRYELTLRDGCGNSLKHEVNVNLWGDCVWPGDANADGIVDMKDFMSWGFAFGASGPARAEVSSSYTAQIAPADWPSSFAPNHDLASGVNFKHADCNGDGLVDMQDAEVIRLHAESNISCQMDIPANYSNVVLRMQSRQNSLNLGDVWEFDVYLTDLQDSRMLKDVYGLMFGLKYSAPFEQAPFFTTENSWLGTTGEDLASIVISNTRQERLMGNGCTLVGISRLDQEGATGSGLGGVGGISITIADIDTYGILSEEMLISLDIEQAALIKKDGSLIPIQRIDAQSLQQVLVYTGVKDKVLTFSESSLFIAKAYPNPSSEYIQLTLESLDPQMLKIEIQNVHGQRLFRQTLSIEPGRQSLKLPLHHIPSGVYFLTIQDESRIFSSQKIIITNN